MQQDVKQDMKKSEYTRTVRMAPGGRLPAKAYEALHAAFAGIGMVLIFNTAFRLEISPVMAVTYVLFFTVLSLILFSRQLRQRIVYAISGLSAIIVMLMAASGGSFVKMANNMGTFFRWAYNYLTGYENSHPLYTPLLSIIFSLIFTLYLYYFIVEKHAFLPVISAAAILVGIQQIFEMPPEYPGFIILLFFIFIQYVKYANNRLNLASPGKFAPLSHLAMWMIPVCIITVFLAVRIPESSGPVQWRWLDSKLNRLLGMQGYTYLTEFDFSRFTPEPETAEGEVILGGDLQPDNNIVLKVTAPRLMYLKGASRDFYTGSSWVATDKSVLAADDPSNSVRTDTYLMIESLQQLDSSLNIVSQLFYSDRVTVRFENLQTKSVFTPAKVYGMNFGATAIDHIYSNNYGVLLSKRINKKGFTYTVDVFTPRYGSAELISLLSRSGTGLYDGSGVKYPDNLFTEKFLQLPAVLPERVTELALKITEGMGNDYDKVKAIEKFLTSNYQYTLSPGKTPPGRDFVDYFLFTVRKGYCTYFASAMTVLVRSLGIPARYVEGYMLPPASNADKTYIVTNKLAHAWTEVYFESCGWMPFEPTAPFNSLFYSAPPAKSSNQTSDITAAGFDEFIEEFLEEESAGELPAANNGAVLYYILVPIGILIVMALSAMLVNNRRQVLRKWLFGRMPPAESITGMYQHMLRRLDVLGYPMLPHETAHEYLKRISSLELKDEGGRFIADFRETTALFIKARYGSEGSVSEHDKFALFRIYGNMGYFEAEQLGRLKYAFYHNLAGLI